jgi:hypothetical protein
MRIPPSANSSLETHDMRKRRQRGRAGPKQEERVVLDARRQRVFFPSRRGANVECGDLSPLSCRVTCHPARARRAPGFLAKGCLPAFDGDESPAQSGDKSPHSIRSARPETRRVPSATGRRSQSGARPGRAKAGRTGGLGRRRQRDFLSVAPRGNCEQPFPTGFFPVREMSLPCVAG